MKQQLYKLLSFLIKEKEKTCEKKGSSVLTVDFSVVKYLLATVHCYLVFSMAHQAGHYLPSKYKNL